MKETIKKILFIRSDRLGEFILSLPAIRLVKDAFPQAHIYVLAKKENINLIKNVSFVDYCLEYQDKTFEGIKGVWKLVKLARKEAFDCVVILNPKKNFHFAAWLARIPLRIGYNRKWAWCLNKKIEDKKSLGQKHEVEYNTDLVRLLCPQQQVLKIDLSIDKSATEDELKKFVLGKDSYVVIHPFTSHSQKALNDSFWMALCSALRNKGFENILMIGEMSERAASMALEKKLKIKNLVGEFEIDRTAALLKFHARVFVGLDSGPMHLASALGVPTVGLFKISNPKRWGPVGKESLVVKEQTQDAFLNRVADIVAFVERTNSK